MCRGFMGRDLDLLASGPGLIQKREVPGFYGSGSFPGFPSLPGLRERCRDFMGQGQKREVPGFYGSGFSWISFGAWSELKERSAGILRVGIFCRDLVYNPKESCRNISGFRSVPEPTEVPGYSGIFRDFVRCLI